MAEVKWIKITTDVFDDEKILLIESLPEADSIIVIWFKLLCLAGKQNNSGVFMMGNSIPYTDKMLATIFRRKEATVKMALETFSQFGMVELIDGVITIPNWEKHQNIDQLEKIKEQTRIRVAKHREKQKLLCDSNVTSNDTVTQCNAIDKNRKEKEEDKKENKKRTPTEYYPTDDLLNQTFTDYVEMRKKLKSPMTERAIQLAMNNLEKLSGGDNDTAVQILEQSVMNSWKGLFALKEEKRSNNAGGIDWSKV
jgi:predicted phage replisome organizer